MAAEYTKPLPRIAPVDAPFWEAARKRELRVQYCLDCGNMWYPPAEGCSKCLSSRYEWAQLTGKGRIWSWALFYHCYYPSFANEIPYNVVSVLLEEGLLMTANIVGIKNQDIRCDLPVEVYFEDATPEITLVKFKLLS